MAETREERIKRSLEALNAPQPTSLTASEWAEILAEDKDETASVERPNG